MTRRTVLLGLLLLGAAMPLLPAAGAYTCIPAQDLTAIRVSSGTGVVVYERLYSNGDVYMQELWQETNGETGLQTAAGMSCKGTPDTLVRQVCIGPCPIRM